MNIFCRTFFCAALLLVVSNMGSEVLPRQDSAVIAIESMGETSEEQVTTESDDDATVIFSVIDLFSNSSRTGLSHVHVHYYNLSIQVGTPPPRA